MLFFLFDTVLQIAVSCMKYEMRAEVIYSRWHRCKLGDPASKSSLPVGDRGPSNAVLLGITVVSLPNGISYRPVALAGCTSVIDNIHTDRPCVITSVTEGRIADAFSDAA